MLRECSQKQPYDRQVQLGAGEQHHMLYGDTCTEPQRIYIKFGTAGARGRVAQSV
jgi:hypothetical protein